MARHKSGLQKNVRCIFEDAAMPDDIHVEPASDESLRESDPVVETSEPEVQPQIEVPPVPETQVLASDVPEAQPEPQLQPGPESVPQLESSQATPDETGFSDPMIEGQMKKQRCEKKFACYKSGMKDLCKARVIRRGKTVQCLEPKKKPCDYRISTLFKRLCQCPIRIHIAKKHKK